MVRLLARIVGVGVETADMLVREVLSRNLRDRRAVARYGAHHKTGARVLPNAPPWAEGQNAPLSAAPCPRFVMGSTAVPRRKVGSCRR
jgi:hypothetical protein